MKKIMTAVAVVALLSAIAVPTANAEFGNNHDRGYDRTGPWGRDSRDGGGGVLDRFRDGIRDMQNFFSGRDVRDRGRDNNRGNGTHSSPTRGGPLD